MQLGAFENPANAFDLWDQARGTLPKLLADVAFDLSVRISRVDLGPNKGVIYRVEAGHFDDKGEAEALCQELKSREIDCIVVEPKAGG